MRFSTIALRESKLKLTFSPDATLKLDQSMIVRGACRATSVSPAPPLNTGPDPPALTCGVPFSEGRACAAGARTKPSSAPQRAVRANSCRRPRAVCRAEPGSAAWAVR